MSFPNEYNENLYRDNNAHLKNMNSDDLYKHYNFYGKHEGLISTIIYNRNDFFNLIDRTKNILEIGPLCFPIMDTNSENVKVLDYFTQDELKENYKNDPNVNINNICKVDYAVKNQKYHEVIFDKFDFCVSSHNIEHSPCIVTFLQNISSVLNSGGYLFLAIPDYRFCFDKHRNQTSIFEVFDKYYSKTIKPQPLEQLESMYYTTHNESKDHWSDFNNSYRNIFQHINQCENYMNSKKNMLIENLKNIEEIIVRSKDSNYVDSHCWKLTPGFFRHLIEVLYEGKIIDLSVERVYKTLRGSNEFFAILKKN